MRGLQQTPQQIVRQRLHGKAAPHIATSFNRTIKGASFLLIEVGGRCAQGLSSGVALANGCSPIGTKRPTLAS